MILVGGYGGSEGSTYLNDVEKYDVDGGLVTQLPNMNVKRYMY